MTTYSRSNPPNGFYVYVYLRSKNSKIAKEFLGSPKKEKRVGDFVRSIKKTRKKMFGDSENTGP